MPYRHWQQPVLVQLQFGGEQAADIPAGDMQVVDM